MRHWTIVGLIVVLAGLFGATGRAYAQSAAVPPEHYTLDPRGVDLISGDWMPVSDGLSIGSGDVGLGYGRILLANGIWTDYAFGGIATCGIGIDCVVTIEGITEVFSSPAVMVFTPKADTGSSLVYNSSTEQFTYTRGDGTVFITERKGTGLYPDGVVTRKTTPTGIVTTYSYKTDTQCIEWEPPTDPELEGPVGPPFGCVPYTQGRLQSYQTNTGYMVHYDYVSEDTTSGDWQIPAKVTALNLAVDACDPLAASCTFSRTWPSITHGFSGAYPSIADLDTDQTGRQTIYRRALALATGIRYPGSVSDDVSVTYAGGGVKLFVESVTDASGLWNYAFTDAGVTRTAVVTGPLGQAMTVVSDLTIGRATSVTQTTTAGASPVTRTWSYLYDGESRLTRITNPEGDYTTLAYDARGNVTSSTAVAKPGSGLANVVTSATYPATCSNPVICNRPTSTTDARGFRTDYVWNGTHGGLESVTAPAPSGPTPVGTGTRPETRIAYAPQTAYYKNSSGVIAAAPTSVTLPVSSSACVSGTVSTCPNTADEVKTTVAYGASGVANNLLPTSVTSGDGSGALAVTAYTTYSPTGRVQAQDGPLAGDGDKTVYRYDLADQLVGVIGPDPDLTGPLLNRARRMTYNTRGQVTLTEAGMTPGYTDGAWSSFTPLQRQATEYDSWGRPVVSRAQDAAGNTLALQQVGYDAASRTQCSATRMNPGAFASFPATSACSPGANGAYGPDRIVQMVYDAASRPISSISGVGTASTITESVTYTANGKAASLTDGNGNVSTYAYDGFDRVYRQCYPGAATCASATPTVYEQYGYDAAGNVTYHRDRAGQNFGMYIDNLNRLGSVYSIDTPSTIPQRFYEYDNLNRMKWVHTPTAAPWVTSWAYDALGRTLWEQVWETSAAATSTVNYGYDAAGRRVWISWPDGFYASYEYNYGNDLTAIRENGNTSWALQTTAYDNLGRRIATGKGNGVVSSWSYDGIGRLSGLSQDVAGTAQDVSWGYTYNPAGQIISRSVSNNAYVYTPASTAIAYVNNILNQLTSINGWGIGHNSRGDITSVPGAGYGYDALGQMTSASAGFGSAGFTYDNLGRLRGSTGSTTRRYLYDGQQVIAEYNESGVIQNRYVPGLGLDDVVTSYDSGGARTWLLSDERQSVVGLTNGSGAATAINTYDEYGVPGASNAGRFQYTGQMWLPDAQLYHYRARAYAPQIGRFMQTDPLGYGAGANIYAYVLGDPMNLVDPFGLQDSTSVDDVVVTGERCPQGTTRRRVMGDLVCVRNNTTPPATGGNTPTAPGNGGQTGTPSSTPEQRDCEARQAGDDRFTCDARGHLVMTRQYQQRVCENTHALQDSSARINDTIHSISQIPLVGGAVDFVFSWAGVVSQASTGGGYRPFNVTIIPTVSPGNCG